MPLEQQARLVRLVTWSIEFSNRDFAQWRRARRKGVANRFGSRYRDRWSEIVDAILYVNVQTMFATTTNRHDLCLEHARLTAQGGVADSAILAGRSLEAVVPTDSGLETVLRQPTRARTRNRVLEDR